MLMRAVGELIDEAPKNCRIIDLGVRRTRNLFLPLRRYIKRERPDAVLVAIWPMTGIACLVWRTLISPPRLVVSEHNDFRLTPAITRFEKFILRYFGQLIYFPASSVVTVSSGVADSISAYAALPRNEIKVIFNPVRVVENATPAAGDKGLIQWWTSAPRTLLAVGSLKKQKSFETLLRAFSKLLRNEKCHLIILGEGVERSHLEGLAKDLGISKSVRMPGFRVNPFPFFLRANTFVLSSKWEGLPGVLIESLRAGTPVVSTDCPSGPAEILENGKYGILVPVGDEDALAEAMERVLTGQHDTRALKARAAEFSPNKAATEYLKLLFVGS